METLCFQHVLGTFSWLFVRRKIFFPPWVKTSEFQRVLMFRFMLFNFGGLLFNYYANHHINSTVYKLTSTNARPEVGMYSGMTRLIKKEGISYPRQIEKKISARFKS